MLRLEIDLVGGAVADPPDDAVVQESGEAPVDGNVNLLISMLLDYLGPTRLQIRSTTNS